MNDKYKRLGKDIIIFALGTLGSKLILFLLVPLYTNVLSTEEYGTADLVFTIGQFLLPCVSLCIYDAVLRFGLMKSVNKGETLYSAFVVFLFGTIITVAISPLLMLYESIASWIPHLVIYVTVSAFSSIMLLYLKAKDLNKLYSLMAIIQSLLLITFNVIFLLVLDTGIGGYLMSNILSCIITAILSFILSYAWQDLRKAKLNKPLLKEMLCYSAPLVLNAVSWGIIHSSDKMMLEMMLGSSMLGLYTVAAKIPSLLNVVSTIFNQAWGLSSIKEYDSDNDKHMYSNVFSMFSTVIFTAFFAICIIIRPFMYVYVGADYYEAWRYVPILLLSACFTAFSSFLGAFYSAVKKSINAMSTTIVAGVCNVVINFCLIPRIGIWGATIGTLTSYVVITVIRMIDIYRYVPFNYNLVRFTSSSVLSVLLAILFSLNKQSFLLVAVLLIIFAVINYKNYILILKNLILSFRKMEYRLKRR